MIETTNAMREWSAVDRSPESRMPTMISSLDLSRDGSHSLPSGGLVTPSSKPRNCQDLVVCGAHLPSLRKADTTSLFSAGTTSRSHHGSAKHKLTNQQLY
jgi:hypothetical protein